MSEDYLFKAVDTVVRKSMTALQVLSNLKASTRMHAVGLADNTADAPVDLALIAETQRTLDQAVMALEEIRTRDQKENI